MCDRQICGTASMFCEAGSACPLGGGDTLEFVSTPKRETKRSNMVGTKTPLTRPYIPERTAGTGKPTKKFLNTYTDILKIKSD